HLCFMATPGGAAVSEHVSCAMGAFTMPPAACSHGALLQYAVSTSIIGDLHCPTMDRTSPRLETARWVRCFERRTSLHALPIWFGCCSRSMHGVSAQKTVHIGCSAGSTDRCPVRGPAPDPGFVARKLARHSSTL